MRSSLLVMAVSLKIPYSLQILTLLTMQEKILSNYMRECCISIYEKFQYDMGT